MSESKSMQNWVVAWNILLSSMIMCYILHMIMTGQSQEYNLVHCLWKSQIFKCVRVGRSSINTVTRLQQDGKGIRDLFFMGRGGKRFFNLCKPHRPTLVSPASVFFSGYRGWTCKNMKLTCLLHLAQRCNSVQRYALSQRIPSWCGVFVKQRGNFTLL